MADIANSIIEYYQRTLKLNKVISADQKILSNILSAANHLYLDEKLDDSIMLLGEGKSFSVYNIGSVIDLESQREIPVAMKLMQESPLYLNYSRSRLEKEIKEYEAAYALGENMPYFMSVVTFFPYGESAPLIACALLTEDISKRHALPLKNIEGDFSRVERTNQDGSKEVFFTDPHEFVELYKSYPQITHDAENICSGEKYLADNARIDLNADGILVNS